MEVNYAVYLHVDPQTKKLKAADIWHQGKMCRLTGQKAILLAAAVEVAKSEHQKRLEEILANYYQRNVKDQD